MREEFSTTNMAEALQLLHKGNHIVSVRMECTWPYGNEECAVLFEGENPEADHLQFIKHKSEVDLSRLPELFIAITAVLGKGGET